jgi:spore coat polysaccharide biosynthesis protein SpsF (cytidylyltransferase family)
VIPGRVAVILQARSGSRRLPGKVLAQLAGATLLEHCVTRLRASRVGRVIVATTMLRADDTIAAEAAQMGAEVFRGSCQDVLERFVAAADSAGAEFVIRATADNPAVDPESAVRLLECLRASGADHAVEEGLPYGCTVEAVKASALRDANATAVSASDREHVTTFVRRAGSGFKNVVALAPLPVRRPDLRFTVDTPAELAYMRRVLGQAGASADRVIPLVDLIRVADELSCREEVA